MAPRVPALAQSESKTRFFARLGLDPANDTHKRVYALMKAEAAEGRRRLLRSQESSTAQIYEAAWRREVRNIFDGARTETKAVYQFGEDAEEDDNWIIRWLLWHVFRYRDYRNRPRMDEVATVMVTATPDLSSSEDDQRSTTGGSVPTPGSSAPESGTLNAQVGAEVEASSSQAANAPSGWYWDPVRERWLHPNS